MARSMNAGQSHPAAPLSGTPLVLEKKETKFQWVLLLLPIGYLWFSLIDNLRLEWESNPQYSFGWVIPILAAGLFLRRWQGARAPMAGAPTAGAAYAVALFFALAFLFLPTRLIEAATPEWRPIQWLLGVETIGLTLAGIYIARGKDWLRLALFPICFFFVAIPWPSPIETPIIQTLSRSNAAMVVEVLGVLGVPAIQHGNAIEVSTGMVGINDACSGIRSLQSSLMVSLFLGEYYMLRWPRRLAFVAVGFIVAMALNLFRTSLLTWIAAKKGIGAIAEYHDEAGVTILICCTLLLWGAGYLLSLGKKSGAIAAVSKPSSASPKIDVGARLRLSMRLALGLIVWLVLVEAGVQLWYNIRESRIKPGPQWSINLPANKPGFKELPLTPEEHALLRFDDGKKGQWQEADGTGWEVYYFDWLPGRIAGYLAKRHTPDICLPATGLKMLAGPTLTMLKIHNLELPMRSYVFGSPEGELQVFQCRWEPGDPEMYAQESSRLNLIRAIWAGRGNKGQKVLEMIATGYQSPAEASQAMVRELEKLISVQP